MGEAALSDVALTWQRWGGYFAYCLTESGIKGGNMTTPDTDMQLPPPRRRHSPEEHMKMSRRFVALGRRELAQGRRLQASEKAWGATAHAVKALGIQRGWNHRGHGYMYDIVSQIREEWERPDLVDRFNPGESHHRNYYNNDKYAADLRRASDVGEQRVNARDLARPAEARSFKVAGAEDPSRRKNLTGKRYPLGAVSPNGFIDERRRWKYPQSRPQGGKNGNRSGNSGNGPQITQRNPHRPPAAGGQSNPSPGSPANIRPRSGQDSPTTGPSDSVRAGNARGRNRRRRGKGNRGDQAPEVNIRLG